MANILGHHERRHILLPARPRDGIYRFGYAWPLHNIVEASRSIMFDVKSEIGKNFGVLFAWICVSVLFPVDSLISRRRLSGGGDEEGELSA